MSKILIIATAAFEGGALTILQQFLSSIDIEDRKKYVLFVSTKVDEHSFDPAFEIYKIDTGKWLNRIYYDCIGYKQLIAKLKLDIITCVNFQNIPARLDGINQIVYMHQSLPLYEYPWKILSKEEFKLWLYSKFYSSFIKMNKSHASYFIVQADWIKNSLSEKIKYNSNRIFVFKPGVSNAFMGNVDPFSEKNNEEATFIYPSAGHAYKNHAILISAFELLGPAYLRHNKARLLFTIPDDCELSKKLNGSNVESFIKFVGNLTHEQLNEYYDCSTGILFPSKIESFGLPLIEAACKGLKIVASELPYAREAVGNYSGAAFASPNNSEEWAGKLKLMIEHRHQKDARFEYIDEWSKVHSFVNNTINISNASSKIRSKHVFK